MLWRHMVIFFQFFLQREQTASTHKRGKWSNMRIFTFISSFHLFMASASGIILAWMFYASETPWLIDLNGNRALIGLSKDVSIDQWINSLTSNYSLSQTVNTSESVRRLLLLHYRFSSLCLLLTSVLLFFITMLAARNRVLTLFTHLALITWLWIFGMVLKSYAPNSIHLRLYLFAIVSSIIGTLSYFAHLYKSRNRIIQQQQQKREMLQEKSKVQWIPICSIYRYRYRYMWASQTPGGFEKNKYSQYK